MKKIKLFGYVIASSLLFWAGFPPNGLLPALFICLLPVLRLQDSLQGEPKRTRWFFYWANFAGWHLGTVWWVSNAHPIGLIAPLLMHSAILAFLFLWIDRVRLWKPVLRLPAFILSILAFEKLIISWDLEFPWLLLGNGLADWTSLAQWYSITGIFGGSLWLLGINAGVYQLLETTEMKLKRRWLVGLSLWVLTPAAFSLQLLQQFRTQTSATDSLAVTVFQPSIDPYGAKFRPELYRLQLDSLLAYCDTLPARSELLVWPETAVPGDYDLTPQGFNWQNQPADSFLARHSGLKWMVGVNGFRFFPPEYNSLSARVTAEGNKYEMYNAAILRSSGQNVGFYNKRKRVVGVEKTPYLHALSFLKNTALDLGGMAGNLGDTPYEGLMKVKGTPVVPIICYESVFPDLVAEMTREGGKLLVIMTNDGWWGNTAGYRQHFLFARLRAIENRRWIARSANTGISGFIGPNGQTFEQLPWAVRGMLTRTLPLLDTETYFTRHGDQVGLAAASLWMMLFAFSMIRKPKQKSA